MPKKTNVTGGELFIVDNSDEDLKGRRDVIGYCRPNADAMAVLIPARSLPVGRISAPASFTARGE